ncbi:MAG: hypothetical protein JWR86_2905 [Enterovirga sp.]|jgi:invasion protein IalB|nr:hypothetical protein [Enterovirga sp.]
MSDLRSAMPRSVWLCAVFLPLALSGAALAQPKPKGDAKPASSKEEKPGGATLVATFGDWGAYTAQSGRSKICYALSEPKSRSPANLKDTKAYLFVSFRPADKVRNEVAAVLNFATKDDGPATLAIGSTQYELVTKGKNAWVKDAADEAQAIATMSKGTTMTLQATSARGNKTTDRYSLAGFAQALERAKRDCP